MSGREDREASSTTIEMYLFGSAMARLPCRPRPGRPLAGGGGEEGRELARTKQMCSQLRGDESVEPAKEKEDGESVSLQRVVCSTSDGRLQRVR